MALTSSLSSFFYSQRISVSPNIEILGAYQSMLLPCHSLAYLLSSSFLDAEKILKILILSNLEVNFLVPHNVKGKTWTHSVGKDHIAVLVA